MISPISRTLSVMDIMQICPMPRHTATDLCKRFGFLCSKSWCIDESVFDCIMDIGIQRAMRYSVYDIIMPPTIERKDRQNEQTAEKKTAEAKKRFHAQDA